MSHISRAGPAHAAALALLHQSAFPHDSWNAQSFATLLAQPGVVGWLDEAGGFLLLRIVQDEAEIITLGVVVPRAGIASRLLRVGHELAVGQGVQKIHLEVAEHNIAARGLYQAFGFIENGRRRRYYQDGSDALTLQLDLERFRA